MPDFRASAVIAFAPMPHASTTTLSWTFVLAALFGPSAAAQSPPNPLQLTANHATAAVTDIDRAVRWYQEVLGFRMVNRGDRPNGMRFADLEIPGFGIGLVQNPGAPAPAPAATARSGWAHIVFAVPDPGQAYATLEARGADVFTRGAAPPTPITTFLLRDSEGNEIEIVQAPAQQAQAPAAAPAAPRVSARPIADGVYIFEYGGYQSMFVVDPGGVLVTDPISPAAATAYLAEIRKLTSAPIRYVVYSHHHFDHIAGGAPFKQAGATFIAHRNARPQLQRLKNPDVVLPDQIVDDSKVLTIGHTRVELLYMGRNHSDNSLVVSVPAKKVIYAVDWLPLGELIWRNNFDSYVDEWFEGIDRVLALDWEKLVVGHVRAHNPKGWGTKDDVRAFKAYYTDLKEAVRVAYLQGLCPDRAPNEVKLPKYESLFEYREFLPMNVDRMCLYWRNGWQ